MKSSLGSLGSRWIGASGLPGLAISITVVMLTVHCVMGKHAERMQPPPNDCYHGCSSAEEEKTVNHFRCQCPFFARFRLSA